MSSITGLRPLKGTSLTNTGFIALNNDLNQGTTGQVIKSNGPGQPFHGRMIQYILLKNL